MNSDGLYKLCYERLLEQDRRRDQFQTRGGFLLTAIVVLTGAGMSLGRLDLLAQMFTRVDVFLFYAFEALVWLGIVVALVFMFTMLWPAYYELIPTMTAFMEWRDDYARQLREAGYARDNARSVADDRMVLELSACVRHAAEVNFHVNMLKQQAFNRCVRVLAATTATLGLALFSSRILIVQGI